MQQAKYKSFLLKFGYWAAIIVIVLVFFKYLLNPLAPFLIALAVAMPIQPLARRIAQKTRISRKFTALLLMVLCYLLLIAIIVLIIVGISSALIDWASMLPDYFTNTMQPAILDFGNNLINKLEHISPKITETIEESLPDVISRLSGTVMDFSMNVVTKLSAAGSKLPGTLLATVVCIIASIFLAADYDRVSGAVMNMLPENAQKGLRIAKHALGEIIAKYLKSYALILLMTFAEISIGLLIIGIDNAFAIAAIIAVFDILPIVGSGIILAPWAIIRLVQGNIAVGVGLAVLWAVVIVVREYAEPRIVGKQVGLHPLVTLMCVWVGLKLGGAIGMFALPIGLLVLMELKDEGMIFVKEPNGTGEEPA